MKKGIKSKTHASTICYLCKECKELTEEDIEKLSNILEKKNIEEIGEGQERREKASYDASTNFNQQLAELTLEDARDFVNKINSLIE